MPEQAGLWTGGGECEPNAACGLDDASAYFKKFSRKVANSATTNA